MIWHFFEVWVLMLAAFAIGCPIGAAAYTLIARSPLADLQGDLADAIGDVVDGVKSRLGIGPVWRPEYRRIVERAAHGTDEGEEARWPDRLPAGGDVLMIADQSARPEVAAGTEMARPVGLAAPRNGVPDDLQRIRGIGRRIEQRLNALGIYHFGQIGAWTPAEMRWVSSQLSFPDRIEREDWIGQAIVLAAGGDTGFVKSADRRRQRRRQRQVGDVGDHVKGEVEADDGA